MRSESNIYFSCFSPAESMNLITSAATAGARQVEQVLRVCACYDQRRNADKLRVKLLRVKPECVLASRWLCMHLLLVRASFVQEIH